MLDDDPLTRIGHTSLNDTGVTAIVAPHEAGMVAAVDVRGGGPGTRETDLLEPHNTVERVHAILLCGGSAFGLAAADGAMQELERRGWGFPVFGEGAPGPRVPIVPAAVIFDLVVGDPSRRPGAEDGAQAVAAAFETPSSETGSVGAGCGATAGVLRGGFGRARVDAGGYAVEANVVANPVGSVVDARTGLLFGDPDQSAVDLTRFTQLQRPTPKLNTTIGVIATDAPLTKAQLKRVAMTGHDGIARAVRPAHSPLDGDTLFAVSTAAPGEQPVTDVETLGRIGEAAVQAVQAAIVNTVVHATGAFGVSAWQDLAR